MHTFVILKAGIKSEPIIKSNGSEHYFWIVPIVVAVGFFKYFF